MILDTFHQGYGACGSGDSVVGIATCYEVDGSAIEPRRMLYIPHKSKTAQRPT
jgi:hypothetical protein